MKNNKVRKTIAAFEAQQLTAKQQLEIKGGFIGHEDVIVG